MGIAELVKITRSAWKRWKSAPGSTIVIVGAGLGGQPTEAEVYAPFGYVARPPAGARGVFIPIGEGRRYGVVIAGANYRIDLQPDKGGVVIYSTNAAGDTVKAILRLDANGRITLNGTTKRFVTYGELNDALQIFVAALNAKFATKLDGGGAVGGLALNISAAETQTVRTGG